VLLPSSFSHHRDGQFEDPTPDARRKHLPDEGDILVRETSLPAILKVPPHFIGNLGRLRTPAGQ